MTKVVNRFTIAIGAVIMILAGIFPIFGALLATLPDAVLGGCTIMMFGTIVSQRLADDQQVRLYPAEYDYCRTVPEHRSGLYRMCRSVCDFPPDGAECLCTELCCRGYSWCLILLNLVLPKNMEAEKVTEQKKEKA